MTIIFKKFTNFEKKFVFFFVTGELIKTQLLNSDGEEVATNERIRKVLNTRSTRVRYGEDLHHQQGDPQTNGNEKCSIM